MSAATPAGQSQAIAGKLLSRLSAVLAVGLALGLLGCSGGAPVLFPATPVRPPRATLRGPGGPVRSLVFSPDGKTLAVGFSSPVKEEERDRPGELRLWDVAEGKPGVTLRGPAPSIPSTAFSPDGRTLAA